MNQQEPSSKDNSPPDKETSSRTRDTAVVIAVITTIGGIVTALITSVIPPLVTKPPSLPSAISSPSILPTTPPPTIISTPPGYADKENNQIKEIFLNVPYYSQRKNKYYPHGSSGSTSLAMIFSYYGVKPKGEDNLADEISMTQQEYGDFRDWNARAKVVEKYGFKHDFQTRRRWSDIKTEVSSARPVLVALSSTPVGVVVCLTGYTDKGFIVNDPWGNPLTEYKDQNGQKVLLTYDYMNKVSANGGTWAMFIQRNKTE